MAYKHGVYTEEIPTALVAMTETDAGLIVAVGTAPVHLAADPQVNKPVLCYTYAEAVAALGYSADWKNYTLCEVIKQHFAYYNMAPLVLINVLDPAKHKKHTADENITFTEGKAEIKKPVMLNTLKVSATSAGDVLIEEVDYIAAYADDTLVITALAGGALNGATEAYITYDELAPEEVTKDDVIGGVDLATGESEGMELIDEVFPRFGLVPGILIAPGFSDNSAVAAVMSAKIVNICGHFNAIAITDIPTDEVKSYAAASEWKNDHSIVDKNVIACWPMLKLDNEISHMSTHLASLMNKTDSEHGDIPYYAPSNKTFKTDGACLKDGKEVYLNSAQANYLNGQGIHTALNFIGGWKSWGVQTASYPSNTDVKDNQIVNRRMFNWVGNTLITSFWSKIDDPANKRLIQTVVDSASIWLNGLVSRGALLGARVEFREDENTTTDLMSGKLRFHVYMTPPAAAREFDFMQEYDPAYVSTLFAA